MKNVKTVFVKSKITSTAFSKKSFVAKNVMNYLGKTFNSGPELFENRYLKNAGNKF